MPEALKLNTVISASGLRSLKQQFTQETLDLSLPRKSPSTASTQGLFSNQIQEGAIECKAKSFVTLKQEDKAEILQNCVVFRLNVRE